MRPCPACGSAQADTAAFCRCCGQRLAVAPVEERRPDETRDCPTCGYGNRLSARFCRSCGNQLATSAPETATNEAPRPTTPEGTTVVRHDRADRTAPSGGAAAPEQRQSSDDDDPNTGRLLRYGMLGLLAAIVIVGTLLGLLLGPWSGSGHKSNLATRPPGSVPDNTASPTVSAASSTVPPVDSALVSYTNQVDGVLNQSAAALKQFGPVINQAESGDPGQLATAASTVNGIVSARQGLLTNVENLTVTDTARPVNAQLTTALQASVVADMDYQGWITSLQQGNKQGAATKLAQANQDDQTASSDKATFVQGYDALLAQAGKPPLPAEFQF